MKKVLANITIVLIFLLIYLLQTNFFNWFNISGVYPNLYVIYILFLGLYAGRTYGVTYGIIFGLLIDILTRQNIGITSIMLSATGFLGGYFDKNFSKENKLTIMLMSAGVTIIYELGSYLINSVILAYELEIPQFTKILLIEILYNTLLSIVLYPTLQKGGYKIEEIIRNREAKLLTRYF